MPFPSARAISHPSRPRATEEGFHIEVQSEAARLVAFLPALLDQGTTVVVDHFGLPDPALGLGDPDWRAMVACAADEPRLWLKLSGSYRLGPDGSALAHRLAPLLRQAFTPARLVFGTDWPHTRFETAGGAEAALDDLDAWLPDVDDRAICLGLAPKTLFGFGTVALTPDRDGKPAFHKAI